MITRRNFLIASSAVSAALLGKSVLADRIFGVDEPAILFGGPANQSRCYEGSLTISDMPTDDYWTTIDCTGKSLDEIYSDIRDGTRRHQGGLKH
jgi:hypothetical protein